MTNRDTVAAGLATALLAGPWERDEQRARVAAALGRRTLPKWAGALVDQARAAYRDPPADRPRELAGYLQACPAWRDAWQQTPPAAPPRVVRWEPVSTEVVALRWPVAALADHTALARLLDVDQGELAWFADTRSLERHFAQPLRHYRWRMLPKGGGVRLVAAPKPRLKEIQRRLLAHVLEAIPVHDAAHGCVRGRSVSSAVSPHASSTVVIRADLEGFFASVSATRVWGLLRTAGLPEGVAHTITGLVTTVAPLSVWRAVPRPDDPVRRAAYRRLEQRLATPHLPQGAPTSPALANLTVYSLDRRLAGLAEQFGARYTRYVDDLTFSGGPSLRAARSRFVELVDVIVRDCGLRLNDHKTVVLGGSGRQQVLGAVINAHPSLPRRDRDALRAIVHNCLVHGVDSQRRGRSAEEFRHHLLGRISWLHGLDPALGARLRAGYDAIDWG